MEDTDEESDRQWDSWREVYEAKRHGKCKNHHDPRHSAMFEADRYCRKHGLPIPGEEERD